MPDNTSKIDGIQGAKELEAWFGAWPSFHDAEILEVHLSRDGESTLKLHTWNMTSEVDAQGYYVLEKHVIVTFALQNVLDLDLQGFNHQNVIDGLEIRPTPEGIELELLACFGLDGRIVADSISVTFAPASEKV